MVRLLPAPDIATIGIGMGYLVLVFYLEVGPIRVLLRDYPKVSRNSKDRDELLTSLFLFWGLQVLAMLLLYSGLHYFVFTKLDLPSLSFLFFGMVIDTIVLSFQDWIKLIFYVDLRQALATRIGFYLNIFRLISYGLLYFWPSLYNYAWILIGTSCVNCMVWGLAFKKIFGFQLIFNNRIQKILKNSLGSYGLWDHLNRMSIDTLFTIDTVVLSLVAFQQLQDIGNYTIALKFTSLFFLIPMQLSRSLQVVLSNYLEDRKRYNAINTFFKVNFIVSIVQLVFVVIGGEWLIHLLFGAGIHPDVIRISMVIAVGVTIMNLGFPLIVGCGVYVETALHWGTMGLAYGNVFIYTLLTISLAIFTLKKYPFPLMFTLMTQEERGLLHGIIKRGNRK
jgi:hypothetical protein